MRVWASGEDFAEAQDRRNKGCEHLWRSIWEGAVWWTWVKDASLSTEGTFADMLWLGSRMSPKGSCVEGLVLNAAVFRDGAFREMA